MVWGVFRRLRLPSQKVAVGSLGHHHLSRPKQQPHEGSILQARSCLRVICHALCQSLKDFILAERRKTDAEPFAVLDSTRLLAIFLHLLEILFVFLSFFCFDSPSIDVEHINMFYFLFVFGLCFWGLGMLAKRLRCPFLVFPVSRFFGFLNSSACSCVNWTPKRGLEMFPQIWRSPCEFARGRLPFYGKYSASLNIGILLVH